MNRMPIPNLVLAAVLALLLPLEQAHCTWMGLERHPAPAAVASRSGHECCESPAGAQTGHHSQPQKSAPGCLCEGLPAGALPPVVVSGTEARSVTAFVEFAVPTVIAPVSIIIGTVPALDIGSPPLPDDPGAHGLRAPPASA